LLPFQVSHTAIDGGENLGRVHRRVAGPLREREAGRYNRYDRRGRNQE
jgi:hypothetical protein